MHVMRQVLGCLRDARIPYIPFLGSHHAALCPLFNLEHLSELRLLLCTSKLMILSINFV